MKSPARQGSNPCDPTSFLTKPRKLSLMKAKFAVLALVLTASLALACVWVETVEVSFISQNGVPIPGGIAEVRYQKNAAGIIDGIANGTSGTDGIARIYLCDQAPAPIIHDYTVTAREPYGKTSQQWSGAHDPARNGTNRIAFEFRLTAYRLGVHVGDVSGAPVGNATVSVRGAFSADSESNQSGVAQFVLPPGTYVVSTSCNGTNLSKSIALSSHSSIVLAPTPPLNNTLEVAVYDELGTPAENATVRISSGPFQEARETDANGTAVFTGVCFSEVQVSVSLGGKTPYSEKTALENLTRISVMIDTRPPAIAVQPIILRNASSSRKQEYEIEVRASISDSVTQRSGINATINYSTGAGASSAKMALEGEYFTAKIKIAEKAPFNFTYWITAIDSAGNEGTANGTAELSYALPMPTPGDSSRRTPVPAGSVDEEPWDPLEPVRELLAPLESMLEAVSTYMWLLVFLVLVVLGGAVFVFLAAKAFFYVRGEKKPKKKA